MRGTIKRIIFPHLKRFREIQQGRDRIIVGGTGSSKYFQKHEGLKPGDADLSVNPCSVSYMFNIIKNYHSYLKKNGEIILLLNPYSLCIAHYSGQKAVNQDIRYYPILHNAMIETYDKDVEKNIYGMMMQYSLNYIFLYTILALRKYSLKNEKAETQRVLNRYISGSHISDELFNTIDSNISCLKELIAFSDERGYKCRIIVMKEVFGSGFHYDDNVMNEILYRPLQRANIAFQE